MSSMNPGGDDDNEDWMPPDDSPLSTKNHFGRNLSLHNNAFVGLPANGVTMSSIDDIEEDEINVIDLEATLNSKHNQEFLQNNDLDGLSSDSISESEFEVESSDVGWSEVLRELRDDGNTDLLERLVKEYNLQSHLDALDVKGDSEESLAIRTVDDGEVWDDEFEQSLEGLSREELIDELIENSPAFSQLEMEILSQELDRSEQEGGGGGLDFDSLDDLDLSDNANYREFRAMVLEDYEKKRTLANGSRKKKGVVGEQPAATTNFATKSDFSAYPTDWKDYDSNSAFKRDFSEDDDSWVRPSTEFVPSRAFDVGERVRPNDTESSMDELESSIDWLQARRSRLGETDEQHILKPTHLLTPVQAESFRHQNSQIPIIPYTLLTTTEISSSLSAQGGTDIHIIDTSEFDSTRFVGIGCNFMMLVTGRNASHIRVLADSIVRNLKARKLHERGVIGASQGVEGGQDIFTNKHSRNRARRNGAMHSSGKIDDDWMVVDCENIHVHILEESTRKCLNIEGLWDLTNPGEIRLI
jgi:ribosomal silencing factor RsfS